jgi:hypothetical protein
METDLHIEGFGAWVLAASLLTGRPDAVASSVSMKTAAVELVKDNTVEHFILLDGNGTVVAAGDGTKNNSIGFSNDVVALIRDSSRRLSLIHNHPRGTSLSNEDILLLSQSPGLTSVTAVTPDGMMYTITDAKPNAAAEWQSRFAKKEVEYRRDWNGPKKLKTLSHEILTKMSQEGLIKYSSCKFR